MESPPDFSSFPPPSPKKSRSSIVILFTLLLIGLLAGSLIGYNVIYADFNQKLNNLQAQLRLSQSSSNSSQQTFLLNDNVSLSTLYQQIKPSVVVIQDLLPQNSFFGGTVYSLQQGSGFVAKVNNQLVIVTNDHVIANTINVTVTFANGDSYPAKVLGSDAQADLAALTVTPMPTGLTPLTLASSESLQVNQLLR
jgi:serine protease Do